MKSISQLGSGRKHLHCDDTYTGGHPYALCGALLDVGHLDVDEQTVTKAPCPECLTEARRQRRSHIEAAAVLGDAIEEFRAD